MCGFPFFGYCGLVGFTILLMTILSKIFVDGRVVLSLAKAKG
jgi:hypothetical protein